MATAEQALVDQPIKRKYKSRIPANVQQAIITKASLGETNSQIARDLDVARGTVINLLTQSDIAQHVAEIRSDMVLAGDLRKSAKVLRAKLNKGSESAATTILRGFNVLRSGNEMNIQVNNNGAMTWLQLNQAKQEIALDVPANAIAGDSSPVQPVIDATTPSSSTTSNQPTTKRRGRPRKQPVNS